MTNNELIMSGELELYVAGILTDERAKEISKIIDIDPLVKKEVEEIEQIVMHLAKQSTTNNDQDFSGVLKKIVTQKINQTSTVKSTTVEKPKVINLKTWAGWAAAAVFLLFFGIQFQKSNSLRTNLEENETEKIVLENKLKLQESKLDYNANLLNTMASENTVIVSLTGQSISPKSKVNVFWNDLDNKVILDVSSLPIAPEGTVYQVWSLKMNPLTPTSLGLLENYSQEKSFFTFENTDLSEGFGITLEPAGGSKSPTLEKLFVIGTI